MQEKEHRQKRISRPGRQARAWLRMFFGGIFLSFPLLCTLPVIALVIMAACVNAYLAWTLSGYEVSIYQPSTVSTAAVAATPTTLLVMVPTQTPAPPTPTPTPTATPTSSPVSLETYSALEVQFATLAAVATHAAELEAASTPAGTPLVLAPETSEGASTPAPRATTPPTAAQAGSVAAAESEGPAKAGAASTSTNNYNLIPIEGERESRPPEEHGDLNLKLREPQPADFEATLIDIPGSGIDPNAPSLAAVFEPNFVGTYVVHDWDWGCNCKGKLMDDGIAVLAGIRTTPGQPIFIPKTDRDIYEGKYYAVVLYAAEDQLTFVYARAGNVVNGYTVHYLGLQTDPNLVKLFQESKGSELPGLTLDTPVGVAAGEELIVAMRDNGTFFDTRSKQDWWE